MTLGGRSPEQGVLSWVQPGFRQRGLPQSWPCLRQITQTADPGLVPGEQRAGGNQNKGQEDG